MHESLKQGLSARKDFFPVWCTYYITSRLKNKNVGAFRAIVGMFGRFISDIFK